MVLFIAAERCTWRPRIVSVCCFTKMNRGRKIATGLQFLLCKSHRRGYILKKCYFHIFKNRYLAWGICIIVNLSLSSS